MKTIEVIGPKCACGRGANMNVTLAEQSDIDVAIAQVEAEMGGTLDKMQRAWVAVQVKKGNVLWNEKVDAQIRRDFMRQATWINSEHALEDGTCPGKVRVPAPSELVGLTPEQRERWNYDQGFLNSSRAQGKTFEERLEHARITVAHRKECKPMQMDLRREEHAEEARKAGKTLDEVQAEWSVKYDLESPDEAEVIAVAAAEALRVG